MAGRSGRPRTPDAAIIDGARRALSANPRASMTEISRTAGVGMSAIYLRFPNRDALLQHFADDANLTYDRALTRAEADLQDGAGHEQVLARFVGDIVDSGLHRLALAIAGTFTRSRADIEESTRLRDRGRHMIETLHAASVLRPGVTWEDLGKLIETISGLQGGDEERSASLRARMVDVMVTGLVSGDRPLVGSAARAGDFRENSESA